ncbi:protein phosphatase 1 regulatory subunit 3C-like [Ornithorhynchus anatinus]|uniref:protein phosphatase 1 regulatory subunit 3C-like n=1 Tax=Ornithorhynchus anatinus TaxID=9258 RepID=UPI0010A7E3BC|nr:protein phosphatase 1 regulatory subunit 3C-like [Ornithorhynchus anatinus]
MSTVDIRPRLCRSPSAPPGRLRPLSLPRPCLCPRPEPRRPKKRVVFADPASDRWGFRDRLRAQAVCLERCSVRAGLLRGTVAVRDLAAHKAVWVRITFDAWASFRDLPCTADPDPAGPAPVGHKSFAFQVTLPPGPPAPRGSIQFCIAFQCNRHLYWDNNQGRNYQLVPLGWPALGPYW